MLMLSLSFTQSLTHSLSSYLSAVCVCIYLSVQFIYRSALLAQSAPVTLHRSLVKRRYFPTLIPRQDVWPGHSLSRRSVTTRGASSRTHAGWPFKRWLKTGKSSKLFFLIEIIDVLEKIWWLEESFSTTLLADSQHFLFETEKRQETRDFSRKSCTFSGTQSWMISIDHFVSNWAYCTTNISNRLRTYCFQSLKSCMKLWEFFIKIILFLGNSILAKKNK